MVAGVCGGERGGLGYFFYEEGIQPAGGVDLKLFRGSLSLFRQRVDLKSERDNLCARPVAPAAPPRASWMWTQFIRAPWRIYLVCVNRRRQQKKKKTFFFLSFSLSLSPLSPSLALSLSLPLPPLSLPPSVFLDVKQHAAR